MNRSSQTMTVDIRLCGNIPRRDMDEHLLRPRGAPCSLSALPSGAKTLSTNCLAVDDALNEATPTHRTIGNTIGVCDGLTSLLLQNKNKAMGVLQDKPFVPLFEPPSWAVPARGETRLEVRVLGSVRIGCSVRVPSLTSCVVLSLTAGL